MSRGRGRMGLMYFPTFCIVIVCSGDVNIYSFLLSLLLFIFLPILLAYPYLPTAFLFFSLSFKLSLCLSPSLSLPVNGEGVRMLRVPREVRRIMREEMKGEGEEG